ncbi:MAG: methyltransferase domain-containing protein [Candidatus Eisenbacteria bacterium]
MAHSHKGKSSEDHLERAAVLSALGIVPGQTILDAGCGYGYIAKEFARALKGSGRVYALDTDSEAIAELRTETEGTLIEALEGDVTRRTPLKPSSIDLIYLSTVFHGFSRDEIPGFLAETTRLLKPHGRLAIVEIKKSETPFGPPLHLRFSPEELRREVGLLPLETVEVGPYLYMQLFENCRTREEGDKSDTEINRRAPVQAQAEVFIDAAPEVVWSTLADIESWVDWNSGIARASLHGPLANGTRFSWKAGGMSIESEILNVSKPTLLAWSGSTFGARAVHVSHFTAKAGGTTAVTEESFDGFLPWLLRGPISRMLTGSLERGLDALKSESERRTHSTSERTRE